MILDTYFFVPFLYNILCTLKFAKQEYLVKYVMLYV